MYTSKYLERFKRLENNKELCRLNGGRVLIEVLPRLEIKTAGGLFLAAEANFVKGSTFETQTGTVGIVLLTGEGYVDTDGTSYELDIKPGNIVMVNDFGIKTLSIFPGLGQYTAQSLAVIDETTIQMTWPSIEDFTKYSAILNGN